MILFMALLIIGYLVVGIFVEFDQKSAYKLRKLYFRYFFIPIGNLKIEVQGDPSYSGPTLFVSNHRSLVDIVLYNYIEAAVVAKSEISDYPLVNKGAEITGIIWVDRSNRKSRAMTKEKIRETLEAGHNVHLFPEGTVSTSPTTLPFKKGAFDVASRLDVPVVPIAIDYRDTSDIWKISHIFKHFMIAFSKWKTEIKIHIGPKMKGKDGASLTQQAEEYVNQQLKIMQKGWSRAFPS